MSRPALHVGARVRASSPGWPALDGHTGTIERILDEAIPYVVTCDDGAERRYHSVELTVVDEGEGR